MRILEPVSESLSRRASLDLLRAGLIGSLAPSQAHNLRGLLNGVMLSEEVVRLSSAGTRDDVAAQAATATLHSSMARFRDAFENFLNHVVNPDLEDASSEPARAMRDAAALVAPLALQRRIAVEPGSCPEGFPVAIFPRAIVTALACAAAEVMKDVADGGRVVFEAKRCTAGDQIVVSGSPSLLQGTASSSPLDAAIAAFGGSRTAVSGPGFAFEVPRTNV